MKPILEQIKTDESVWPDDATYYHKGYSLFYLVRKGILSAINSEDSFHPSKFLTYCDVDKSNLIPRPTKAFVPEVGAECEVSAKEFGLENVRCDIRYLGDIAVFFTNGEEFACKIEQAEFSQINYGLDEFMEKCFVEVQIHNCSSSKEIAEKLYVAGCRFEEQNK